MSISTNGRLHKYNPTVWRKVVFFPRLFMWGGLSAESEMSGTTGQAFPDWWKRLSAWHSYRNSHQHWPSNAIQNTKYRTFKIQKEKPELRVSCFSSKRNYSRSALDMGLKCKINMIILNESFALWGICQANSTQWHLHLNLPPSPFSSIGVKRVIVKPRHTLTICSNIASQAHAYML